MNPLPNLPDLRIVETELLQPHEEVDGSRLEPLMNAIRKDGMLKNPPVVAPLRGESERYIVLDGANRTMALQQMSVPHTLVQVVQPHHESIQLRTWNQVVVSGQPDRLRAAVDAVAGVATAMIDLETACEKLKAGLLLACLTLKDGTTWEISTKSNTLDNRIQALSKVIAVAGSLGPLERTGQIHAADLLALYPDMAGLLVLHNFVVEEVMIASANGLRLPSGITRFIVAPRALRLNYPLEWLLGENSRQEKQTQLEEWLRRQVTTRGVRYYAEPTFLFDE